VFSFECAQMIVGLGAVGEPRGIARGNEIIVGKSCGQRFQDGEAADPESNTPDWAVDRGARAAQIAFEAVIESGHGGPRH